MQETVLACARDLFGKLGLDFSDIEIRREDDVRNIYFVTLKSQDSKLLIGPRGQTLATVEYMVGLLSERLTKARTAVHIEVNDYRASQDEKLFRYIDDKVRQLKSGGGRVALHPLTSYERKKVHSYVDGLKLEGLKSTSVDEPAGRTLYLSYEGRATLSIDLDAAGI